MAKPSYLSPFEAPRPAEIDSLPVDGELLFLDIHSINALRSVQHSIHAEAIDHIRGSHGGLLTYAEIEAEAIGDCTDAFDEVSMDFLKQFISEDAPRFDEYLRIVRSFSIDKISEEEMALGRIDDTTGERDEDTAGYKLLDQTRTEKVAEIIDPAEVAKAEKVALAAEKKAEYEVAKEKLDLARTALAKAEVEYRTKRMFKRKLISDEEYTQLKETYESASRDFSATGFAHIKTERDAAGEPPFTPKELNVIAQTAFAREFGNFVEEQSKISHLTEEGKKVRMYGEATLKKKFLRTALVLGAGVLGMATGGVFAAGFYGAAAGLRVWQVKSAGTVGHSTAKGTERITRKINRGSLRDTNAIIDLNDTDNTDALADIIATGHRQVAERTRSSNSRRRKMVPILIGSALVGGALKGFSEYESSKDTFAQVKQNLTNYDWNPFRTHDVVENSPAKVTGSPAGSEIFTPDPNSPGGTGMEGGLFEPPVKPPIEPASGGIPDFNFGTNPATGDLFRSTVSMDVLDGQGFIYDVEAAGIVPKGYGAELANFLHERGIDNGAHIPGFKYMGMWHTATGSSTWSNEATVALQLFKNQKGL